MKLTINDSIFKLVPGVNVGAIIVKNVDNSGTHDMVDKLLVDIQQFVRDSFVGKELSSLPSIAQWREVYKAFGAKPKKYKCSVEALMKRVLNYQDLPKINKIVDLYNYMSLKETIPMGGDNLDKIDGDIILTLAKGTESFLVINGKQPERPHKGEVVYKDSKDVLCRRWNWRECDKTKITEDTKNVIIYAEALPPISLEKLQKVLKDMSELVETYCGGEARVEVLSENRKSVEL